MTNNLKPGKDAQFYGLDNLRAFAIVMVLLFHYPRWFEHPSWFPKVLKFGWTGVDLFFVLSGFLIASQLFAQIKKDGTFSIKDFYIKRVFRILPIYYFVLAIYFLFPVLSDTQLLPPLWKFLTFTQNFGADFQNHRSFGVVWSLCVEEHFYLLLPATLLLFLKSGNFKKGYYLLVALFVAGFIFRLYGWFNVYVPQLKGAENSLENKFLWVQTIYYPTYCRLDGLLAGVSIAALFHYLPSLFTRLSKYANGLIVLGALVLMVTYFICGNDYTLTRSLVSFPLASIGYGCLVLAAIMPGSFLYKWKSAVLTKIAHLSYALYLVHMAVILMVQKTFFTWGIAKDSNLVFLLCILFCFVFALILHYTIEKPFMKMRKRFLQPATVNNGSEILPVETVLA
jgi:peptidoglycan/LPS O-acetylase OafA/YrhL